MDGSRLIIVGVFGMVSSIFIWEKIYNINLGIDFGMFNNCLNMIFEYFICRMKDMVGFVVEVGVILGIVLLNINNVELKNKGWEL